VVLATLGILAAASGSELVLLFSGLGGLSGLAALAMVWVNYRSNARKAEVDDKSVAIIELEKAVPGLGEIIKEWQSVVHQLQADLAAEKVKTAEQQIKLEAAEQQLAIALRNLEECKARIAELERGIVAS
jgi:chromosome segregation ATPase